MEVLYIKCLECGKRTMNFELGDVFCRVDEEGPKEGENDVLVKFEKMKRICRSKPKFV